MSRARPGFDGIPVRGSENPLSAGPSGACGRLAAPLVKDYYKILGIPPAAPEERIRRAYRVLARRYHPDVNPDRGSADKFKEIAEAYGVLSIPAKRKKYDARRAEQIQQAAFSKIKAYQQAAEKRAAAQDYYEKQHRDISAIRAWQRALSGGRGASALGSLKSAGLKALTGARDAARVWTRRAGRGLAAADKRRESVARVSVIELPVSMREAVYGIKKTISISEPEGERRINVTIPPGVRTGSILRLKSSSAGDEELVLIVRLERHPHLTLDSQGLTVDVPVTIGEAINGAAIKIPALDEELMIKLPPNTQSGARIRVKEKGIVGREGRGDLFARILVRVPEAELAVGLKEKASELDLYYEQPVRAKMPKTILEEWP